MYQDRRRQWHRILGRLRRILAMPGVDDLPLNLSAARSYRRSPPEQRRPPEADNRPEGIDVYPGMDRDFPGPTDPDVFNRPPRPPTPRQPIYEVPRMTLASVEAAMTPGISSLIDEVLEEINRESSIDDVSIGSDPSSYVVLPDTSKPPPPYSNVPAAPATRTSGAYEYVEMASQRAEAGSSRDMQTSPVSPTSPTSGSYPPTTSYDNMREPSRYYHPIGEMLPIPQGSPPLRPPMPLPTPIYYRDYANPRVRPAYNFICHSAWYIQVTADLALCPECATSEHTFCVHNRPAAAWRQLHVLSRTFVHTSLHCGRCYKLLINTRRAIDCYHCRTIIIELHEGIEHLTYRILCEAIVPRVAP